MNINVISGYFMQTDARLQKEAFDYFENLKLNPNGWKICVESLLSSQEQLNESAIFFCLQVIEDYVKTRYDADCDENRSILRGFIFTWFTRSGSYSGFVLNKFALVVNASFLHDFPSQRWDAFFEDFLNICLTEKNCDQFLRILLQINADVADREIPRTHKENERNNLIKDKMRETCLLKLAEFWFNIIKTYRDSSPPLVCLCLNVIGAYVAWIDISLITNDCVMSNLFSLFAKPEYRCAVCDCFNGILHKGMEPQSKIRLIEQFMEVDVIKQRFTVNGAANEGDLEFALKLAKLFNTIGVELVDSGKKLKPKQPSGDGAQTNELIVFVNHAIEQKFATLCQFLSCKNYFVSLQVHPFARDYIQWLKNAKTLKNGTNDVTTQQTLITLLKIVISHSSYPLDYDFSNEEEREFDECRKSLRILFENLMLLDSAACLDFLCANLFEPVLGNWRVAEYTFAQVEVSLYFLYLVGENFNLLPDQKKCEDLVQLMVTSSVSTFPHFVVHLMYFEIILRYEKYFSNTLNFLVPQVLISFLDERGFKNSSLKVRSRVSHIFNKFVKSHIKSKGGSKLQSFAEDVMKRLQDFLKLDVTDETLDIAVNNHNTPKPASIFDEVHYFITEEDQLLIYETVSVLIVCNTTFDCSKKLLLLKNLLFEPVWCKFDSVCAEISSMESTHGTFKSEQEAVKIRLLCKQLSHCISLIARTSKAFSNVQTIKSVGAHPIYLESFNIFMKSLKLNVDEECLLTMQSAARQLLHRLIVCLDEADIVPLLPVAIANIFLPRSYFNVKAIQELVPLINQVVSKFKHSWMFQRDLSPFLKQLFLPTVSCIFTLTADANLAVEDRQSLHKSYYAFLHVLVTNGVLEVLADIDPTVLEQILMTLVQGAVEFPDITVQKSCFFVIKKIIEFQSPVHTAGEVNGANKLIQEPFFHQFIYKTVIPACFYGQLRQMDENQLTTDCVNCLKAVQSYLGQNDFCSFLQMNFFPQHFPAFSHSAELVEALVSADEKRLKHCFKMFFHQYKKIANV